VSENAYLDTIGSIDKAARVLTPIFEKMNIVFSNPSDASILLKICDVEQIIKRFSFLGSKALINGLNKDSEDHIHPT
jgi:hypothetical protein